MLNYNSTVDELSFLNEDIPHNFEDAAEGSVEADEASGQNLKQLNTDTEEDSLIKLFDRRSNTKQAVIYTDDLTDGAVTGDRFR